MSGDPPCTGPILGSSNSLSNRALSRENGEFSAVRLSCRYIKAPVIDAAAISDTSKNGIRNHQRLSGFQIVSQSVVAKMPASPTRAPTAAPM